MKYDSYIAFQNERRSITKCARKLTSWRVQGSSPGKSCDLSSTKPLYIELAVVRCIVVVMKDQRKTGFIFQMHVPECSRNEFLHNWLADQIAV